MVSNYCLPCSHLEGYSWTWLNKEIFTVCIHVVDVVGLTVHILCVVIVRHVVGSWVVGS